MISRQNTEAKDIVYNIYGDALYDRTTAKCLLLPHAALENERLGAYASEGCRIRVLHDINDGSFDNSSFCMDNYRFLRDHKVSRNILDIEYWKVMNLPVSDGAKENLFDLLKNGIDVFDRSFPFISLYNEELIRYAKIMSDYGINVFTDEKILLKPDTKPDWIPCKTMLLEKNMKLSYKEVKKQIKKTWKAWKKYQRNLMINEEKKKNLS